MLQEHFENFMPLWCFFLGGSSLRILLSVNQLMSNISYQLLSRFKHIIFTTEYFVYLMQESDFTTQKLMLTPQRQLIPSLDIPMGLQDG
jgi:hypothetical protein